MDATSAQSISNEIACLTLPLSQNFYDFYAGSVT